MGTILTDPGDTLRNKPYNRTDGSTIRPSMRSCECRCLNSSVKKWSPTTLTILLVVIMAYDLLVMLSVTEGKIIQRLCGYVVDN